jgi:autotransporter-associated beta strand protein
MTHLFQRRAVWAIAALLVSAFPSPGREWFAATNGSDAADGTLGAPFLTLARAVSALAPGDTLYLRGGTYRETLQPLVSGTPGARLTITAYPGEPVSLTGCDQLAGPWSAVSNGIYAASAGWSLGSGYNQVFADGTMQHEARHPNHGAGNLLEPATAALTVSSNYTVTCSAFDGKGDLTGARFYAGVGSSWAWQNALVASNRTGMLYLNSSTANTTWWWPNYAAKSSDAGRGFLYGHPNLLDDDSEWFLQTNAAAPHTLLVRLPGGTDPSTHRVEMKRRAWCVDINNFSYITVSNLTLRAGAVRLNGTGLVFAGCEVRHASHFLVFTSGGTSNGGRTEGGGVVLSGVSNTVASCTITDTAGSGILASGTGHLITRNHVYNTDYSATYAACLVLSGNGLTASFNTLHDTGRDILRPTGKGLRVLFNDLYYAGRLCKDLGAVYAWGTDGLAPDGTVNRIAYNWVHDSTPTDPLSMGIYIDNYSRNFQIDHNVVWNFGVQETLSWSDGLRLNAPCESLRLFHNTAFRCNNYDRGTYTAYQPGSSTPDSNYWTPTNHHLFYLAQNNLYMTNSAHELVDAGARDFRPKPGSFTVDPLLTTKTLAWSTTNGVENVPPTYRLSMRYKNQFFGFEEQGGTGVPVDTDGDLSADPFVGTSPDSGAYELDAPYWEPGVAGWLPECPGVRCEFPLEYVGTVVTARGLLVSAGSAPTALFLYWGQGDAAAGWTNAVCLGTAFIGTFQPILYNLTGIQLFTTYGYRFLATNAFGQSWSAPTSFTTGSGLAQSATWDAGGGTDISVESATNWVDDVLPDLNGATHAHFGSGGSSARVDRDISLYGMTFGRNGTFDLMGEGGVTLRAEGITAAIPTTSSRTYTIGNALTLADPQRWSVTNNGSGVTTLNVTHAIADSVIPCGITKVGDGTLYLRGASSYGGATTVSNGLVAITHPLALGSTSGATVVRSTQGGRLQVGGGITVAEPLTLNGERANSGYSMINSDGSNVWSGLLTRIGQTRINVAANSTFVLTGGATGGGGLFVVNGNGTLLVKDKPLVINSDAFWADSAGLSIVAVSGNVWGDTILGRGILRMGVANALPPTTKLKIGLNYAAGGTFDLNGFDQTVAQLLHNTATAAVRTVTSPAPATLTVNQSADTAFDGQFTGMVRLLKTGTGTLTLSGTNLASSGGITVSNGTLLVTAAANLGSGPVSLAGGTLRNGRPSAGTLAASNLVWLAGGTLALSLAADSTAGRIDLSGGFTRGEGSAFTFDFGGSGVPSKTYTLITFSETTFQADDFRSRNLGSGSGSVLQGVFSIRGNTLTLRTLVQTATVLLIQ